MSEHVVVVSHRRSGTHLTIDAIRNNFSRYRTPYLNLDDLRKRDSGAGAARTLVQALQSAPRVLKSHTPSAVDRFFGEGAGALGRDVFANSRVIYVYRDGRDVMTSFFHYARSVRPELSSTPFSTFLRMADPLEVRPTHGSTTNAEYWQYHVSGWLEQPDVLFLSFESLVLSFDEQVKRIGRFLEQPAPARVRRVVRMRDSGGESQNLWSRSREKFYKIYRRFVKGIDLTSVNFRQGRIGSYRDTFSSGDLAYFEEIAGDVMERLGYELVSCTPETRES